MKTIVQLLYTWIIPVIALLGSDKMLGQIDYGEDFTSGAHGWTNNSFEATSVATCDGTSALRARMNNMVLQSPAVTVSPSIGVSNGEEISLTYSYRLLNYDAVLPAVPVDLVDFGAFTLQYSDSANGPWTDLDNITLSNYDASAECTERIVTFRPPADRNIYLRFKANLGISPDLDYYVYLDNVNVIQSVLTVGEPVDFNALTAYPNPVTDYLTLDYEGYIDNVVIFNMQGQEVSAIVMDNNMSRLDLTALSSGTYTIKVMDNAGAVKSINVVKN